MVTNDAMQQQTALDFFAEWTDFSKQALKILAPSCPAVTTKTRPWNDGIGPIGILMHYTAGPDGIASIRWGNENPANTKSSWPCTVFDHRLPQLDGLMATYPLVDTLLYTTAILHAKLDCSTWHGNWTNDKLFGIENRNLGLLGKKYQPRADKPPVTCHRHKWEPYSLTQILTNINIGRMLRYWRGCKFKPHWILPHSAVWGTKFDTGPCYPIHHVRNAIFTDFDIGAYAAILRQWHYADEAPRLVDLSNSTITDIAAGINETVEFIEQHEGRDMEAPREWLKNKLQFVDPAHFAKEHGDSWRTELPTVMQLLYDLGYYTSTKAFEVNTLDFSVMLAIRTFQLSTHAPKYKGERLVADGIPGPKTLAGLKYRHAQFYK